MDVDALEVNAMTESTRAEYMKKGLCFKCGKPGHLSREHNEFVANTPHQTPKATGGNFTKKPPTAAEIARYIRAMNQEEQDTLFTEVEKDEGKMGAKAQDF